MWDFEARLSRHHLDLIHNLSAECLFPGLIAFTPIIEDDRRGSSQSRKAVILGRKGHQLIGGARTA